MQYSIVAIRYVVFGLFVAFSAVVASVAVWNLTFLQVLTPSNGRGNAMGADSFLIFVGTSGLVVVFTILFIELARRNAFTSRLWFEATWTSVYLLMNLSALPRPFVPFLGPYHSSFIAGAITVTVIVPKQTCVRQTPRTQSCRSTHVLLAFIWMNMALLLLYWMFLALHIYVSSKSDQRVWLHNIHNLSTVQKNAPAAVAPSETPRSARWIPETIAAPQPRRPAPTAMYSYRSGLSPDYRIEHFEPPPLTSNQAGQQPLVPNRAQTFNDPPPENALYPQFLQPTLAVARAPVSTAPTNPHAPTTAAASPQSAASSTPSPLGDWPRADIMKRPSDRKKPVKESRVEVMNERAANTVASPRPSSSRQRPGGPRT
ncbi:hypothetical protein V5O48_008686, partial [Marasmius crinis-equi]